MTGFALRIGLVVPRFAPFHGGMETYAAHAALALAAKGAKVTVVRQAPRRAGLPSREVHDGYPVERHHAPFGEVFDLPSSAAARAAWRFEVVWVHHEVIGRAGSGALAELCPLDAADIDSASQYAHAITRLLSSTDSAYSEQGGARCPPQHRWLTGSSKPPTSVRG